MRRRHFLTSLACAAVPGAGAPLRDLPAAPVLGSRMLFLDRSNLREQSGAALVPAPVEKLGLVMGPGSPGDAADAHSAMGCGLFRAGDTYRLYYSGITKDAPVFGVCVAESKDLLHWTRPNLGQIRIGGADTNRIRIEGIPESAPVTQPSIVPLPRGGHRMYFWLHQREPVRRFRYLAADSDDGIRWRCVNAGTPCLVHPHDIGKWPWLDPVEAREQRRADNADDRLRIRSNDATHTYAMPGGGFEMFTVFPVLNTPATGRYVAHDNAPFMLRVMTRRTSEDGLRFSDPEFIVVPDAHDPWDQQFYYLTQHRFGDFRIGFLGHYRVHGQTMDIELAYSQDGRRWERPMRGAWIPRGPKEASDSGMVYMPNHLVDRGDHWLALYTGSAGVHNQPQRGRCGVHAARIARHRFAGLSANASLTARVQTKPFFLGGTEVRLDAAIEPGGVLRAELCGALGQPLKGLSFADSIPTEGDSPSHVLRWKPGTLDDYRFHPVSLRVEWTRGVVYGVDWTLF